jgi:hypothetical protein
MSLRPPGAERSDEEAVAEELMGASRRVKIFENDDGGWALETQVNTWLEQNPGVEILEFFPVSISVSVALAMAKAATQVNMSTSSSGMTESDKEEKERTVAAVGIYYTER